MAGTTSCGVCNTEISSDAKFCGKCGQAQVFEEEAEDEAVTELITSENISQEEVDDKINKYGEEANDLNKVSDQKDAISDKTNPKVDSALNDWKKRLLDFTRSNRLLHFKETKASTIKITEPSLDKLCERLTREEKSWFVADSDRKLTRASFDKKEENEDDEISTRPLAENEVRSDMLLKKLPRALYNLLCKSRTELEERGISILYLALGILSWFEDENSDIEINSPTLLVPVKLERAGAASPYQILISDEEAVINPTLIEKMKQDFNIDLELGEDTILEKSVSDILQLIKERVAKYERWKIKNVAYLSYFSFHKLSMYKDLENHRVDASNHPLVAAIAGEYDNLSEWPDDIPTDKELDEKVKLSDTFQILDADSSQQVAIEIVKRGTSIVLQGPPGTGKSQTIANIIADSIARNKRVLFVSEKLAALNVVFNRLSEVGLGDYCIELHSDKTNKKDVINNLSSCLNRDKVAAQSLAPLWNELDDLRNKLNKYVADLHKPQTAHDLSIFKAYEKLSILKDIEQVFFKMPGGIYNNKDIYDSCKEAVRIFDASKSTFNSKDSFAWIGLTKQHIGMEEREGLFDNINELNNDLSNTISLSKELQDSTGLEFEGNIDQINRALKVTDHLHTSPGILKNWLVDDELKNINKAVKKYKPKAQQYNKRISTFMNTWNNAFFEIDVPVILNRFDTEYKSLFSKLSSNYREDKIQLIGLSKEKKKFNYKALSSALKNADLILKDEAWLSDNCDDCNNLLGYYFDGADTDWDKVEISTNWTKTLLDLVSNLDYSDQFIELCVNPKDLPENLKNVSKNLYSSVSEVSEHITALEGFFDVALPLKSDPFKDEYKLLTMKEWITKLIDNFSKLDDALALNKAIEKMNEAGLDDMLVKLEAKTINDKPSLVFEKRFLIYWLDKASEETPTIRDFHQKLHDKDIFDFKNKDKKLPYLTREYIKGVLSNKKVGATIVKEKSSETSILNHEANKKRRQLPLRKLFPKIPNLLTALKPCMMMSPLTVSQYLTKDRFSNFDLLLFDEASQIKPEDAICSIIRANQIVVVGDSQQLPPSSFFETEMSDDDLSEDSESIGDFESILDKCSTFLHQEGLKWHYRSRREDLVTFSNAKFYNNSLITFPSPNSDKGIEFHYVSNGCYDGGKGKSRQNIIEAKEVAKQVFAFIKENHKDSLGVVAFSQAQETAIRDEIEFVRQDNPQYEHFFNDDRIEKFFIKNLENVQGDERDCMIVSVGYGPDSVGKISHNFGPINKKGGERRLNVVISRAKKKLKLVTSMKSSDINLSRTKSEGAKLLKSYLDFAERGIVALKAEVSLDDDVEPESPFEAAVFDVIRDLEYEAHLQVGCSGYRIDIGIVDPENQGRYLLGVECDGATYHSAATARDRDRLRQQVLKDLGWRIYRIWSTDWIRNRESEIERLKNAIELAKKQALAPTISNEEDSLDDSFEYHTPPEEITGYDSTDSETTYYSKYEVSRIGSSTEFYRSSGEKLGELLKQVVDHEGPIHKSEAMRRVANAYDLQKVTSPLERHMNKGLKYSKDNGFIFEENNFLWPTESRAVKIRIPEEGDSPRGIKYIPKEEITLAITVCLEDCYSLEKNDLIKAAGKILGFKRISEPTVQGIAAICSELIRKGKLSENDDIIKVATD